MEIIIKNNPAELGKSAGSMAAQMIRDAIKKKGKLLSYWPQVPANLKRYYNL